MKTEELIQSYRAILGTLNGLAVSGVENCKAIAGCAAHIESQLAVLSGILQAENEAAEKIREKAAAAEAAPEEAGEEESA